MMNFFQKRMRKDQKGFTLVELLVVITILGILATLAVQTLGDRTTDARQNKVLADLRTIASALELYKIDNGDYVSAATASANALDTPLVSDYIRKMPNGISYSYKYDPANDDTYTLTVTGTWGGTTVSKDQDDI